MRRSIWIGIIITTIILAVSTGIIVHVYSDEKVEQATIESIKEINRNLENQIVVQTVTADEKTSPNAKLTFETYYSRCGHSKIEKKRISSDDVNKTESELEEAYPDWKIKNFSAYEITFYKDVDTMCDDHYIIKEKNGYVTIYSINGKGKEKLKEQTEIATQYLPDEDVELLKKGIKANSSAELEQIISDYE